MVLVTFSKRSQLISFLKYQNCNIYLLQETHGISKLEGWEGFSIFNPGTNLSCGVTILFSSSFNPKILDTKLDSRILSVKFLITIRFLTLLTYIHQIFRPAVKLFFNNLHSFFFHDSKLCIGGDFTCLMSDLDKHGG